MSLNPLYMAYQKLKVAIFKLNVAKYISLKANYVAENELLVLSSVKKSNETNTAKESLIIYK